MIGFAPHDASGLSYAGTHATVVTTAPSDAESAPQVPRRSSSFGWWLALAVLVLVLAVAWARRRKG